MIITELEELSADRCKVYIDQEFAFVLYKGELRLYKLSVGKEISEEDYCEIIQTILPKRAKLRAMNLLIKRRYTEKQLTDKLEEGFYPPDIIEEAIEYVKSFRYLDDFQFALDYITYHEDSKSERKMTGDLLQKGISGHIIKQAFDEWKDMGGFQNEQEMIRGLLEKKHYSLDSDDKEKRRIYAFLLRRGFSVDNVNKALHIESY